MIDSMFLHTGLRIELSAGDVSRYGVEWRGCVFDLAADSPISRQCRAAGWSQQCEYSCILLFWGWAHYPQKGLACYHVAREVITRWSRKKHHITSCLHACCLMSLSPCQLISDMDHFGSRSESILKQLCPPLSLLCPRIHCSARPVIFWITACYLDSTSWLGLRAHWCQCCGNYCWWQTSLWSFCRCCSSHSVSNHNVFPLFSAAVRPWQLSVRR